MEAKKIEKALLWGLIPTAAGAWLCGKTGISLLSDGFFVAALTLGVFGLFRLTRRLHLYDSVIYSFLRFRSVLRRTESTSEKEAISSRAEYEREYPYEKTFREILLASGIYLAGSVLTALLS